MRLKLDNKFNLIDNASHALTKRYILADKCDRQVQETYAIDNVG